MQTSAKDLTPTEFRIMLDRLATLLADWKNPQEIKTFLETFFTPTEQIVFAKRLAIICLLEEGKSYDHIRHILNVSSATISSTALTAKKPVIRQAYRLITIDQKIDRWLSSAKRLFSFSKPLA